MTAYRESAKDWADEIDGLQDRLDKVESLMKEQPINNNQFWLGVWSRIVFGCLALTAIICAACEWASLDTNRTNLAIEQMRTTQEQAKRDAEIAQRDRAMFEAMQRAKPQ